MSNTRSSGKNVSLSDLEREIKSIIRVHGKNFTKKEKQNLQRCISEIKKLNKKSKKSRVNWDRIMKIADLLAKGFGIAKPFIFDSSP